MLLLYADRTWNIIILIVSQNDIGPLSPENVWGIGRCKVGDIIINLKLGFIAQEFAPHKGCFPRHCHKFTVY